MAMKPELKNLVSKAKIMEKENAPDINAVTFNKHERSKTLLKQTYKKRSGTSGVTGQLYETKLLSLILHRALKDKDIKEFCLGTNLDSIGAFDDICFKIKLDHKCVIAFIQAKHRDEPRKNAITDYDLANDKSDFCLKKYFESYIRIKEKFQRKTQNDLMFIDSLEDIECCLIIYTPAENKITRKKYARSNIEHKKIKEILSTRHEDDIFQIQYDDDDINLLSGDLIGEQLNLISKALIDCIVPCTKEQGADINIEIIKKHIWFLIPNVIVNCDQNPDEWTINEEMLLSSNQLLIKFRDIFCEQLLLFRPQLTHNESESFLANFCMSDNLNIQYLSKIVGDIVIFNRKTNKLELVDKVPNIFEKYRSRINNLQISQAIVREAIYQEGKKIMLSVRLKLPSTLCIAKSIGSVNNSVCKSNIFIEQTNIARQFLDNLFFYTKEAKQNEVENILKHDIHNYYNNNFNNIMNRVHSEALFFKLHDKIQKWSMLQGNVFYLTEKCDFLVKSIKDLVDNLCLTTIDINFTHDVNKYNIDFKSETVNILKLQLQRSSWNVALIFTDILLLTSIKLVQCLKEDKRIIINLEAILNLGIEENQILFEEIRTVDVKTLVLVVNRKMEKSAVSEFLNKVIATFTKQIIILSDHKSLNLNQFAFEIYDKQINFVDLTENSQNYLLSSNEVVTQGHKVPLGNIIENISIHYISGEILLKLLKNEDIVIGKNLNDVKYNSVNKFYIPRYLKRDENKYKVNNFKEVVKPLVVLTAEPGMGKSTLLSHLSIETKICDPKIWIARINLLDHCSEFLRWQNECKKITLKDTMTLVCKIELNAKESFELQVSNGNLGIKHSDIKGPALLQLELIVHSYNNGTIVFIFDGFDEICPHYEKEAVALIKTVMKNKVNMDYEKDSYTGDNDDIYSIIKQCMVSIDDIFYDKDALIQNTSLSNNSQKTNKVKIWIASRPYNSIKQTLEEEFEEAYCLEPWSFNDQQIFCHKYFESCINFNNLSLEQFNNIESFFEFMSQFRRIYRQHYKVLHVTNIPLNNVYGFAVDFFRNSILHSSLNVDREKIRNEWVSKKDLLTALERCIGNWFKIGKAIKIAGFPLHMYIAANYFVNEIFKVTEDKDAQEKWDLSVNTFGYFERFLETKFKTIRLEDKNQRYISCPDERIAYEKEKKDFIEIHKKLAFFAVFQEKNNLRKIIPKNEYAFIKAKIREIEKGEEKTGLIHCIHNKVPRFIHLVFAEYFALEYVSDKIKSGNKDLKRKWLNFVVNKLLLFGQVGIITVLDHKLKHDEELIKALSDTETKKTVFQLLMEQNEMFEYIMTDDDIYLQDPPTRKIQSSLSKALSNSLTNVVMFLLSGIEINLNEHNLETFIELLGKNFFISAGMFNHDNILLFVLDKIKMLDPVVVSAVLKKSNLPDYLKSLSEGLNNNEEILKAVYEEVRQLTTPYWYYDTDDHTFYPYNF